MRTNSDPKTSESEKPRQGWIARCIPALSVRDWEPTEENPNRPVVTKADLKQKKRKIASSPTTKARMSEPQNSSNPITSEGQKRKDFYMDVQPALEKFKRAREGLIDEESKNAWDEAAKTNASQDENDANDIIKQLRDYDREEVFMNMPSEEIPGPETLDMGGQFLTNKERIETKSKIYEIAKMVPKGALLHLHFNAELHPKRLLKLARAQKCMYVSSNMPLLEQADLQKTEMTFKVWDAEKVKAANIFESKYKKAEWMQWSDFRKEFNKKFGYLYRDDRTNTEQEEPAETWIMQKMVLSSDEAYNPMQTVNGVWARFNQATRCFKGLLNYESAYKWYIGEAIDEMIQDKIMYAELRVMLLDETIPTDDGKLALNRSNQMKMIKQAYKDKKRDLEKDKKGDDFPFCVKVICCTPRSFSKEKMVKEMEACIELKKEFNDLICGYDLVGAEDRPNSINFYEEELVAFRKACEKSGVEIPFIFHAGETLIDAGGSKAQDPKQSNLFDAVALNCKRIGHGFSLLKHPDLVEKFRRVPSDPKQPGICIELCPISNELLHLCRNVKEHPYPELLAAGIPCTVNSDNPSLFSNSMSHEFYQIMVGSPTMSLFSWKQLAEWSLDYSCLSENEKQKAKRIWLGRWIEFCRAVVRDYKPFLDNIKKKEKAEKEKANQEPVR